MLRKFVCAVVIGLMGCGVALADEFAATITKVDNGKVTFKKGKTTELGQAMTLPVTADVKVTKGGTFNKETKKVEGAEAVAQGVRNELLAKINDQGVRARITTDAGNKHVTAIYLMKKKAAQ